MYGLSLLKGLGVTMKNLVSPGRMFTVHQYPDRKIGLLGLARLNNKNPLAFVISQPGQAVKAIVGLASVRDRQYQHPRFRGRSSRGTRTGAPDAPRAPSTALSA